MQVNLLYIFIFLIAVFMSSVSQILLKKSANKEYDNWLKEYMNFSVIMSYGLFFCSSFVVVLAYKGVPLAMGPVLEATGYIWVSILGGIFLKERINRKKVLGLAVIVIGILVFSIP